jgi:hypothetical protein
MIGITEQSAPMHRWRRADWACLALLLCLVTLAWCWAYNRWTATAWNTPIYYGSDAWGTLAGAKAFSTGEIPPILSKHPASLGAPFQANWDDYPTIEEGIWVWVALLVRVFGLFRGTNLSLLSAHLLAASSFYFVARRLQCSSIFALAGAAIFAVSRFIFARSLLHLFLAFYWHVPLGILVLWYCLTRVSIKRNRRLVVFCVLVVVLHGVQNLYYTAMFLQFLVLVSLYHLLRRQSWERILFPLGLAAALLLTVGVMNADTLYHRFVYGSNGGAIARNYAGLELYAMKPLELFVPIAHRIAPLETWAITRYARQAYVVGEMGSPYLGMVGIAGFLLLLAEAARRLARRELNKVPFEIWPVLWIFAYSVIGGINCMLGLFGMVFLRSTNRYSIFILTLVLLFLMRRLTSLARQWHWVAACILAGSIVILGVWDQIPGSTPASQIAANRRMVQADEVMVATLENKLPRGAMVFQMPVMEFPEVDPRRGVADYEHLRPYLYSKQLRFSYGNDKGRDREKWQKDAEQLEAPLLAGLLERYGFSAILINRKGYEDGAATLLRNLQAAGKTELLVESPDFFGIALTPVARPALPP